MTERTTYVLGSLEGVLSSMVPSRHILLFNLKLRCSPTKYFVEMLREGNTREYGHHGVKAEAILMN